MGRLRTLSLAGIALFVAILAAAMYAKDGSVPLRFHVWKVFSGRARGGQYANINGVRIHYEMYGTGSPVLVLHGGLGSIAGMSNQIRALAASHFVIAADTRGHGQSTDSDAPLSYSAMSDDMLTLLDCLRIDRADVVGWSDGAIIALDLAMHHPDRVRKVVAISANYDVDGLTDLPSAVEIPRVPLHYRLFAPDPAHWPTLYRKVVKMWQTQPHYTVDDLGHIRAPTLVMAGEFDGIKREHTDRLAKAIPNSQELIIEGGTHSVPFEKPGIVNAHILTFLDDQ
jgi:pimeloyl-ACP methyl ester carboxylesterase